MRGTILLFALTILGNTLFAQNVYTIKADSVKITNCDSSELIIENHTQNIPGFLFNTGNGRTIFKRGAQKLNDSLYLVGSDTIKIAPNPWVQGGNAFGATGILGTLDSNDLYIYTNNIRRARLTATGSLILGTTGDLAYKLNVNGGTQIQADSGVDALTIRVNGAPEANSGVERAFSFNTNGPTANILNNSSSNPVINELRYLRTNNGSNDLSAFGSNYVAADFNCNTEAGLRWKTNGNVTSGSSELEPSFYVWHGSYIDDALRIFSNGNIGIGVGGTNSGYKLQVNGTGSFSSLYTQPGIDSGYGVTDLFMMDAGGSYDNQIGTAAHDMFFQTASTAANFRFRFGPYPNPSTAPKELNIQGGGSGNIEISSPNNYLDLEGVQNIGVDGNPLNLFSDGYGSMNGVVVSRGGRTLSVTDPIFTVVEADTTVFDALKNGNIGIGTNTPSAQLHTTGSVRFAGLTNDDTQTRVLVSDASGNLFYRSASSLASNDILRSSLAVNGTISAKRLQLSQTDWPDYVFDSRYRLLPMDQLEEYIRQNKHLPGIPSAAEVEKKGVDVGENQAALLKKIEELTLYTIDQNKVINSLKQEVDELKKLILKRNN